MPNVEWDVAQTLVSPYATLDLNTVIGVGRDNAFFYMVRPDGYQIVPGKFRAVIDSVSQADGSSLQPPFIDGLVATLKVSYWTVARGSALGDRKPACDEDLRLMHETLMGVLNSLRVWTTDPNTMQRYLWTPTGTGDRRMLTNALLTGQWPVPDMSNEPEVSVTFQIGTPYPYAIDATEVDTVIASGGSAAITNPGNAAQAPVMRVAGATSAFTITNTTTGQKVVYDSTRPGAVAIAGGHFAEIDFFQGSIFLDGNGADLVAGLDPTQTDFFPLEPGAQTIGMSGATVTILHNGAWV